MVYILKGKVSWLRLVAIIWTASSDAARQACGKAAARWGNAQAVTLNPSRRASPGPGPTVQPGPGPTTGTSGPHCGYPPRRNLATVTVTALSSTASLRGVSESDTSHGSLTSYRDPVTA